MRTAAPTSIETKMTAPRVIPIIVGVDRDGPFSFDTGAVGLCGEVGVGAVSLMEDELSGVVEVIHDELVSVVDIDAAVELLVDFGK